VPVRSVKNPTCERKLRPFERTAIAIDKAHNLLLIYAGEVNLFDLMDFLKSTTPALNIEVALNMSGSSEAGILVKGPKQLSFGNINALIPSALAVQ
jgi:hypothetical protein